MQVPGLSPVHVEGGQDYPEMMGGKRGLRPHPLRRGGVCMHLEGPNASC